MFHSKQHFIDPSQQKIMAVYKDQQNCAVKLYFYV